LPFEKGQPKYDYKLNNRAFIRKSLTNTAQKADMHINPDGVNGGDVLNYVTAWFQSRQVHAGV
jgi:hypothetical protein